MTVAPRFQSFSIVPIIAWTVNGGSTPTTEQIMLVEGSAVLPVGASVARITCTGPNPPPIARPVMAWTSQQCQTFKTCLKCQAPYTVVPGKRHRCGYAKCPVCRQWVSIQDHKCYRFSSTFNLTELKKGFFPHLFNTPDHQQYVVRIPDLEFYDPEGMVEKKKQKLARWHSEQVRRNVVFDFHREMVEYCQSDVALLKAGCQAFQQEFERQAGFNPMAKCMTIASASNLYWRQHHLPPDTIAVEPLRGWRGANVNHSLKALQWLYYREQLLPKEGASADRIRHVRNGGEQSVRVGMDSYFVDGYHRSTRTAYEF